DLFLDTAPYGAHTTASDALWMGVPVLTLSGKSFASRVCGSLVRSAGLPELVCTKIEDYVARAIALGKDRARIEAFKARLEAGRQTCTLFNTDLLVTRLEALYRQMAGEYQKGKLPQPNLANLESYLDAGTDHDHESEEMLAVEDYAGFYKTKLKELHLSRPMGADGRLWTEEDIALADAPPALVRPARRRKTGT
ncbi:MAG TPA: hypothetical protein VG501_03280, partial [Rhizomicrobium sp.]|nr:hypothetical protein [Rhizomicrobium sp.]